MNNYYSFFKPIEVFHLLGIITSLYLVFDFLNIFSIERLEWAIYFLIYFIGILFFIFSFLDYKKIYLKSAYFFSFIFIIFFIINFSFSFMDVVLLLISFIFVLILNNSKEKKILKIESLFYWMKTKDIFWKDILGETNNLEKFIRFLENFSIFTNLNETNYQTLAKYFQFSYPVVTIIFVTFILTFLYFDKNNKYKISIKKNWWILPSIVFFLESFSTSYFFSKIGGGAMVHWQAYIGTIELMQNKGFLLWDTPSQYGFFSSILIYLMPFDDPWIKLYILNSSIKFFISILFFRLFWNKGNIFWYFIVFLL